MVKKNVTLINTPQGYLWAERGKYYKTVKGAKIAIKREDKLIAKNHGIVATFLEIRG